MSLLAIRCCLGAGLILVPVAAQNSPGMGSAPKSIESSIEEAVQEGVFKGLTKVSVNTHLEELPAAHPASPMSKEIHDEIEERVRSFGLEVVEDEGKLLWKFSQPVLSLSAKLLRLPDSRQYVGYYMELALIEQVDLKRVPAGQPPAKTYVFSAWGQFTRRGMVKEFKDARRDLLDRLGAAIKSARQAAER